jgi:hypothetical protein
MLDFITCFNFISMRLSQSHDPFRRFCKLTRVDTSRSNVSLSQYFLKIYIVQYVTISIFKKDIIQYILDFESMINLFFPLISNDLVFFYVLKIDHTRQRSS